MTARAELDFYVPAKDYAALTRQRRDANRAAMFAWRGSFATTAFDAHTGARRPLRERARLASPAAAPREHVLPGTQRAAQLRAQDEEARRQCGAGGVRVHWLRTLTRGTSQRAQRQQQQSSSSNQPRMRSLSMLRAASAPAHAHAYYHDSITLCAPPTGQDTLAFAITHNTAEVMHTAAVAAAAAVASTARTTTRTEEHDDDTLTRVGDVASDDSDMAAEHNNNNDNNNDNDPTVVVVDEADDSDAWVGRLGPTMAMRQHALQLATTMHHNLLAQQHEEEARRMTTTTMTMQNGNDAHTTGSLFAQTMPLRSTRGSDTTTTAAAASAMATTLQPLRTCELAYTLRPSYVAKKKTKQREERRRASRDARAKDTLPAIATRTHTECNNDECEDDEYEDNEDDECEAQLSHYAASHRLPAEAKNMRVYAIRLRRHVADCDASMVRRQEPLRRGLPVLLPPTWRTPMT